MFDAKSHLNAMLRVGAKRYKTCSTNVVLDEDVETFSRGLTNFLYRLNRYCRLRQYNTLYICGTDEYGTATETKVMFCFCVCRSLLGVVVYR